MSKLLKNQLELEHLPVTRVILFYQKKITLKKIRMLFKTIEPSELNVKIQNGGAFKLIDVREPEEFAVAQIDGAKLLPLSEFQNWHDKFDPADELIFLCHHGVRSAQVCAYLAQEGFTNVWNLSGGIDAWSTEVDRRVPRY